MPGFDSGKNAKSMSSVFSIDVSEPETTGEKMMRMIADASPPYMLQSAPLVVNRFQNSE